MNPRKNKTLVTVVVLFMVFGLVMAYIPFLSPRSLAPETGDQFSPPPPQAATLVSPPTEVVEKTEEIESPTSSEKISPPESFLGLEEESESLSELDSLLEDLNQ